MSHVLPICYSSYILLVQYSGWAREGEEFDVVIDTVKESADTSNGEKLHIAAWYLAARDSSVDGDWKATTSFGGSPSEPLSGFVSEDSEPPAKLPSSQAQSEAGKRRTSVKPPLASDQLASLMAFAPIVAKYSPCTLDSSSCECASCAAVRDQKLAEQVAVEKLRRESQSLMESVEAIVTGIDATSFDALWSHIENDESTSADVVAAEAQLLMDEISPPPRWRRQSSSRNTVVAAVVSRDTRENDIVDPVVAAIEAAAANNLAVKAIVQEFEKYGLISETSYQLLENLGYERDSIVGYMKALTTKRLLDRIRAVETPLVAKHDAIEEEEPVAPWKKELEVMRARRSSAFLQSPAAASEPVPDSRTAAASDKAPSTTSTPVGSMRRSKTLDTSLPASISLMQAFSPQHQQPDSNPPAADTPTVFKAKGNEAFMLVKPRRGSSMVAPKAPEIVLPTMIRRSSKVTPVVDPVPNEILLALQSPTAAPPADAPAIKCTYLFNCTCAECEADRRA